MSLFGEAGKKFEETKQSLLGARDEYVCASCEATVAEDYDHCPHCGEATVEPVE